MIVIALFITVQMLVVVLKAVAAMLMVVRVAVLAVMLAVAGCWDPRSAISCEGSSVNQPARPFHLCTHTNFMCLSIMYSSSSSSYAHMYLLLTCLPCFAFSGVFTRLLSFAGVLFR